MPAPIRLTTDLIIPDQTDRTFAQTQPVVVALADGSVVIQYRSIFDSSAPFDTDVLQDRITRIDGVLTLRERVIAGSANADQQSDVAVLADGRISSTYVSDSNGGTDSVRLEVAHPDFTPAFGDLTLTAASFQHAPVLAAGVDGGFAVAWMNRDTIGAVGQVELRFFDAAGVQQGTQTIDGTGVLNEFPDDARPIALSALPDGGYAMIYITGLGERINYHVFTAVGSPVVNREFHGGTELESPKLVAHEDGRVSAFWVEGTTLMVRTLASAESVVLPAAVTVANGVGNNGNFMGVDAIELADGRVMVVYVTSIPGGDIGNIRGRMINADGTLDGGSFAVNVGVAGAQGKPSLAELADGRVVVTWQTDNGTATPEVHYTYFDPREAGVQVGGTNGADVYEGGRFGDVILGLGGEDQIAGMNGNDSLFGGGSNDRLFGGNNDDLLSGGTGKDTLNGGAGNDTFTADAGNDSIIGDLGLADVLDYSAATENLTIRLATATVTSAAYGTDSFVGIEVVISGSGNDTLEDMFFSELVQGGTGNDSLTALLDFATDTLVGGLGNDTYRLEEQGNVIVEGVGGGVDTVEILSFLAPGSVLVDFTLGEAVEIEVITIASESVNGAVNVIEGNSFAQTFNDSSDGNELRGNGGADTLNGNDGDDILLGESGADVIFGGNGRDFLDGGEGGEADRMYGGADDDQFDGFAGDDTFDGGTGNDTALGGLGNDLFFVQDAGDDITEFEGEGTADRVAARESFSLLTGSNARLAEIELLGTASTAGTTAINLTGNTLRQTITGNAGDNVLHTGGGVADRLVGLTGNDTYRVFNAADEIVEVVGGGTADRVAAAVDFVLAADDNIEVMTTNGNTGTAAIDLTGNAGVQAITGNAGANRLNGGAGNDTLTGLGGADVFVFTTTLGATNIDNVTDYNVAADRIEIDNAAFLGLTAGALNALAFTSNTTGTATTAAHRIIYETDTGALWFDRDGSGAAFGRVQFADLTGGLAMTSAEFTVI